MGIEIINEPNTTTSWPMMNVTERSYSNAVDHGARRRHRPDRLRLRLKDFYVTAYHLSVL